MVTAAASTRHTPHMRPVGRSFQAASDAAATSLRALVENPADTISSVRAPCLPTKQSPSEPTFEPYQSATSRRAVYAIMAPVMWLAKQVLTTLLRAMGAKRHLYRTDHASVAIWDIQGKGQGPVAVLMHGLGGSSAEYFPTLLALRARCSRVISVDLPGHGDSAALGRRMRVGFTGSHAVCERMVSAVTQAVQHHLGDLLAHFIGHSLGGFISARVVGTRIREGIPTRLLLTETDGAPWSQARMIADRRDFGVPTAASARRVARSNYPLRPVLGWLYTPFLWARLASPEIQYLTHSDLKQPILPPNVLGALPPDTMVIAGQHDKFGTEEDVAYLVRHLPRDATLRRPNTGHGDIADAHPEICAIFDEFLRRNTEA